MIKGLGLAETKDFVSSYDKDDQKTIWKVGVLDSDIFDLVENSTALAMTTAVRFGLKGFENFVDSAGKPVVFSTKNILVGVTTYAVVADSIMKIISPEVKYELAVQILKMSKLSEDEIKN